MCHSTELERNKLEREGAKSYSKHMNVARIPMIFLLQFVVFLKLVSANDHCKEGKCQTYALDIYGDAVENSELVDHVFHKFPTINPIHCHSSCADDCRCLSFNYKEKNEEKVCELNEGSHFINQSSLTHFPGSRYYNLRREFSQKVLWIMLIEMILSEE